MNKHDSNNCVDYIKYHWTRKCLTFCLNLLDDVLLLFSLSEVENYRAQEGVTPFKELFCFSKSFLFIVTHTFIWA